MAVHPCNPNTWGDKRIPGACWIGNLAELMSFRFSESSVSKIKTGKPTEKSHLAVKSTVVLPEDPSSVCSTQTGWLTVPCNSGSRAFDTLFWPLRIPVQMQHTYRQMDVHIHKHKIKILHQSGYWERRVNFHEGCSPKRLSCTPIDCLTYMHIDIVGSSISVF